MSLSTRTAARAGPACARSSEGGRRGRSGPVLAAALAAGLAWGADAARAADSCANAACLARDLVERVPDGERVALIPFAPPASAIPRETADMLYHRIARALQRASKGRHRFVAKDDLQDAVWESWESERRTPEYEAFWEDRRVGVVVHCRDLDLAADGIALECRAAPVGEASRLAEDLFGPPTVLRVERPYFPYRYTLSRLARDLARRELPPLPVGRAAIFDAATGERGALAGDIEKQLRNAVEERLAPRRRALEAECGLRKAMGRECAPPPPGAYRLRGEIAWMDDGAASVSARLVGPAGDVVAEAPRWIAAARLPKFAGDATRRYAASARAVASDRLSADSARRAARNLARARVVAKGLDLDAPALREVRSEADAVLALRGAFGPGVPADGRFEWRREGEDGAWEVAFSARVRAVGGRGGPPRLEARLAQDALVAGEKLEMEFRAPDEALHLAVFGWFADDKAVRLFPRPGGPAVVVPAGGTVVLPRKEDKIVLRVGPMPGSPEDHEAIVAVASVRPLDAGAFGRAAGKRTGKRDREAAVDALLEASVSGDAFLEALARLDLSGVALAVLPYRVTAAPSRRRTDGGRD